jgi:hypothetical protein
MSRLELRQLGSAMARLRAEHEEEHAQLQAAEAAAVKMERSCEEVEALRACQADLADSITLMQSLLKVPYLCRHHHLHPPGAAPSISAKPLQSLDRLFPAILSPLRWPGNLKAHALTVLLASAGEGFRD